MPPRGRQANGKARISAYEVLIADQPLRIK
jgi:hypothetical protein